LRTLFTESEYHYYKYNIEILSYWWKFWATPSDHFYKRQMDQ